MKRTSVLYIFSLLLVLLGIPLQAVCQCTLSGKIVSTTGEPLSYCNIVVSDKASLSTSSDKNGSFTLTLPSNKNYTVRASYVGMKTLTQTISCASSGKAIRLEMEMEIREYNTFEVAEEYARTTPMQKLDPKIVAQIPTAGGHFESILNAELGVSKSNELSSQYSVRGGNFDENLVYVNGIQVYRPFLVRSGQQEGLSFVNADMVSGVLFSPGGFESRYGDKMSSVLDITYNKEPRRFGGTVNASLLGVRLQLEDASDNYRFTQLHGFRYHTNQYLLGSLDTQGDYKPAFMDYQGYFTYDLSDDLELGILANLSRNKYEFIPSSRQSDFGTINQALRLSVFFEGQEVDAYETYFGALSLNQRVNDNVKLRYTLSGFRTNETETFDLLGAYRLDELNRDLGSDDFGDVAFSRGTGAWLAHARNFLTANVLSATHDGKWYVGGRTILWGLKGQFEDITDEVKEWTLVDSAGYSIPINPSDQIVLQEVIQSNNHVQSGRVMGYLQENVERMLKDSSVLTMTIGGRFNYWTFNQELLLSPRTTLAWNPNWKKDVVFRASWGYYYQPPFYREMRDLYGTINENIKAQQSIHYVLGMDYNFKAWSRPFKFVTEVYHKTLNNLIPYEIDNVRIRYYATNNARGYVNGIDMKVNGEFVKGVDSWASLSLMSAKENILDDFYTEYLNTDGETIIPGYTLNSVVADSVIHEPGYIPRPTDQRVNFGLFFQDYLPKNPTYKMHLNLLFGTGLPTGPPTFERYKDTLRIPPYRRVDIGFSKQLLSPEKELSENNMFRHFNSIWLSLEVFNLLQINNTISYLWVKDVTGAQYGIPNYLTNRRINLKLVMKF